SPCPECPAMNVFQNNKFDQSFQTGVDKEGHESHYMMTAAPLMVDEHGVSKVIEISLDVSAELDLKERLKKTERDLIESERLAAVGQTVAGLSHGIKNVLMGLEGGMYVVNSGLSQDNDQLVKRGWTMLENNITKVSTFVKEFLSFAKGSKPQLEAVDPLRLARDIVELYQDKTRQLGIDLETRFEESLAPAPMDPEGIHTCLANLVSNAVDACLMSVNEGLKIVLSCFEKDDTIYYTVEDNGC
ncbi:unnamed protein product, partial [marine sediment metagenome]